VFGYILVGPEKEQKSPRVVHGVPLVWVEAPAASRRRASSRVELAEVLDVPRVLHRDAIFGLQPCCAGSGDLHDPERSFPHRRELVEAFTGKDPPEDEVTHLESAGADVAAVVATQFLLVASRTGWRPGSGPP
jgi:hypothetical protein